MTLLIGISSHRKKAMAANYWLRISFAKNIKIHEAVLNTCNKINESWDNSMSPVAPNMPKVKQITKVWSGLTQVARKMVTNRARAKAPQNMEVTWAPSALVANKGDSLVKQNQYILKPNKYVKLFVDLCNTLNLSSHVICSNELF